MDDDSTKKSLSDVFGKAIRAGVQELDLWDLAQLPKKRQNITPPIIVKYRETIADFLADKMDEEKCAHRLRVLTGMSARETDSLIIKLKERQIIALKSK